MALDLDKTGQAVPGISYELEITYVMIKHLSERGLCKLLKVWKEGKMAKRCKEVVIIPIRKQGKDASKPGSY